MQTLKQDLKIYQNNDFLAIREALAQHTKKAYFVGGVVRDEMLGIQTSDIDIEVYDISVDTFENLMAKLGTKGVGKSFFVYKYGDFDISLPRTESKNGIGHKAFDVALSNDEKTASARRDFTINAMMKNIFTGEILDFYGGKADLQNRILRVVNEKTFADDSLRVLRAVQFVARFGLLVDTKSLNLMKNIKLDDLSKDRIKSELIKLFKASHQDLGLGLIFDLGIFEFLFGKKIAKNDEILLTNRIKNGSKIVKNEMYFLYILSNLLDIDKKALLNRLNLSSIYKKIISEPYFSEPSPKDLFETALNLELKNWLGLDNEKLIDFAKKYEIYENKFITPITSQTMIDRGFKGKKIGENLKKENSNFIQNFIKAKGIKA